MSNGAPNTAKGFAGLDELVSDLDTPSPTSTSSHQSEAPDESSRTQQNSSSRATPPTHEIHRTGPTGDEPIPSFVKWLVGGAIAFVVILIASNNDTKGVSNPSLMNSSATPPAPTSIATPPSESQSAVSMALLEESVPPEGTGLKLNTLQIRYCLAEKIRIGAVETIGSRDVERFNSKVAHYNARCANFKYRRGSLESIRSEVELRSQLLGEQARLDWFAGTNRNTQSSSTTDKLPRAPKQTQPTLTPKVQQQNNKLKPSMPANSKLDYSGHDWECKRGFRQVGNECESVRIPANAKIDYLGHDWECNRGFRQVGNECESVRIPANAKIDYLGHDWECRPGFQQIGQQCR